MIKKKMMAQAASLFMCAAVLCPTYSPVAVLAAADTSGDTLTATENVTEEETTPNEEQGEIPIPTETPVPEALVENAVSIYFDEEQEPMVFDKGTTFQDFLTQLAETYGVAFDSMVKVDVVDNLGMRTRISLDAASEEEGKPVLNTVEDFYNLVAAQSAAGLVFYDDSQELLRLDFTSGQVENTLDAVKSDVVPHTVTFNPNGGTLEGASIILRADGESISYLDTTAVYDENHTFIGWFDAAEGGNEITAATVVTSDMEVFAQWESVRFQLTFDSCGGSEVEPMDGTADVPISELPTPEREGYIFEGWYDSAEGGNQVTSVILDEDVTLYAHWSAVGYQLKFDSQGGSAVESMTGSVEDTITNLPTPKREGYTFEGWYDAAEGGNKVTSVVMDKDTTLYAHWTQATYLVTLDDGMGNTTTVSVDKGKTYTDFPTLEREGYTFKGWFTQPEGGSKVNSYSSAKDATFYAQWEKDNSAESGGNNGENTDESQDENVEKYTLTLINTDGQEQQVTVNDNVELGALSERLGYNVDTFSLKTSSESEHLIDSATTMKQIAEKTQNGEVLLIAYDANGEPLGSAKVTRTGDTTFTVALSKDTNVALDAKGQGENETPTETKDSGGNTVAQDGKADTLAEAVQTGDVNMVPLIVGTAGIAAILIGLIVFLRKKGYIG